VLAALIALGRLIHSAASRGPSGLFNDFYDYWAAASLLNRGQDPYDIGALHAVQRAAGLRVETGTGYSYPLFFAHLLRPLALLSANSAAYVFMVLSLVALVIGVALLISSIPRLGWRLAIAGGAAAGLFPPVIGSLYFGQANLIVLMLIAIAYRELAAGATLGVASAIKLYPLSAFLALLMRRRWRDLVAGLGLFALLMLFQLGPHGGAFAGRAGSFFAPDTYWSNESINGWLSRLAIASTWTKPPYPGFPVQPVMLIVVALLALATVLVLLRASDRSWQGALALSAWLGIVGAPKNSLWNFTPLLVCVVFAWTQLHGRWWIFAAGVAGWLLIELQAQLDSARETVYQASPALAWLSSVGLYGAIVLGALTAYVMLRPGSGPAPAVAEGFDATGRRKFPGRVQSR
jgi:hypothetical protein